MGHWLDVVTAVITTVRPALGLLLSVVTVVRAVVPLLLLYYVRQVVRVQGRVMGLLRPSVWLVTVYVLRIVWVRWALLGRTRGLLNVVPSALASSAPPPNERGWVVTLTTAVALSPGLMVVTSVVLSTDRWVATSAVRLLSCLALVLPLLRVCTYVLSVGLVTAWMVLLVFRLAVVCPSLLTTPWAAAATALLFPRAPRPPIPPG